MFPLTLASSNAQAPWTRLLSYVSFTFGNLSLKAPQVQWTHVIMPLTLVLTQYLPPHFYTS